MKLYSIFIENFPQQLVSVIVFTEKSVQNISLEVDERLQSSEDAVDILHQWTEAANDEFRHGGVLAEHQGDLLGAEGDKVLHQVHGVLHHVDVVLQDICTTPSSMIMRETNVWCQFRGTILK